MQHSFAKWVLVTKHSDKRGSICDTPKCPHDTSWSLSYVTGDFPVRNAVSHLLVS